MSIPGQMLNQMPKNGSFLMLKDTFTLTNVASGDDLPEFKGLFVRYARKYAIEGGKSDLDEWLLLNASVA
ncbi:MAG: hypothetical protein ACTHML_17965 [Ginsengibacter sp.]